jgi:hypothetical protein
VPSKIIDGYRFFFYSNEPPHMHVWKGGSEAKIWLGALEFAANYGFGQAELTKIRRITRSHLDELYDLYDGSCAKHRAIIKIMTYGTVTFPAEPANIVQIADVAFEDETLIIGLTDGRSLHLAMPHYAWLRWLLQATPEQRRQWTIVPSGGGVWWPELDEGIELKHLLDLQPLT